MPIANLQQQVTMDPANERIAWATFQRTINALRDHISVKTER